MKIVNGKWQTGNLNDKLVATEFDRFFNLHRSFQEEPKRIKLNSKYNYQFKKK